MKKLLKLFPIFIITTSTVSSVLACSYEEIKTDNNKLIITNDAKKIKSLMLEQLQKPIAGSSEKVVEIIKGIFYTCSITEEEDWTIKVAITKFTPATDRTSGSCDATIKLLYKNVEILEFTCNNLTIITIIKQTATTIFEHMQNICRNGIIADDEKLMKEKITTIFNNYQFQFNDKNWNITIISNDFSSSMWKNDKKTTSVSIKLEYNNSYTDFYELTVIVFNSEVAKIADAIFSIMETEMKNSNIVADISDAENINNKVTTKFKSLENRYIHMRYTWKILDSVVIFDNKQSVATINFGLVINLVVYQFKIDKIPIIDKLTNEANEIIEYIKSNLVDGIVAVTKSTIEQYVATIFYDYKTIKPVITTMAVTVTNFVAPVDSKSGKYNLTITINHNQKLIKTKELQNLLTFSNPNYYNYQLKAEKLAADIEKNLLEFKTPAISNVNEQLLAAEINNLVYWFFFKNNLNKDWEILNQVTHFNKPVPNSNFIATYKVNIKLYYRGMIVKNITVDKIIDFTTRIKTMLQTSLSLVSLSLVHNNISIEELKKASKIKLNQQLQREQDWYPISPNQIKLDIINFYLSKRVTIKIKDFGNYLKIPYELIVTFNNIREAIYGAVYLKDI